MDAANADNAARPAGHVASAAAVEGDIRELIRSEVLSRKPEPAPAPYEAAGDNIAPFIRRIGDASIAEIDRLIAELQAARNYLQSEGERIQRDAARYAHLSQTASASVKVISESLGEWRKAGRVEREPGRIDRDPGRGEPGRGERERMPAAIADLSSRS